MSGDTPIRQVIGDLRALAGDLPEAQAAVCLEGADTLEGVFNTLMDTLCDIAPPEALLRAMERARAVQA